MTDLYLKVFGPLKVSKKHFKELVKEARVLYLDEGDIYAVEDVSPADERLSILLKGKYVFHLIAYTSQLPLFLLTATSNYPNVLY